MDLAADGLARDAAILGNGLEIDRRGIGFGPVQRHEAVVRHPCDTAPCKGSRANDRQHQHAVEIAAEVPPQRHQQFGEGLIMLGPDTAKMGIQAVLIEAHRLFIGSAAPLNGGHPAFFTQAS